MAAELLVSVDGVTAIVKSWCVFLVEEKVSGGAVSRRTKKNTPHASDDRSKLFKSI